MNRLKDLTVLQAVQLTAAVLAGLLVLLLLVGAVWAMRLPPAPVVLPSADSLQAAVAVLPEPGTDEVYLTGYSTVSLGDEVDLSESLISHPVDETVSMMAARPLFWEGRRPVQDGGDTTVEETATVRSNELDKVELTGVYFAGEASGVIVRSGGQRQRLAVGGELLGWRLESVSPDSVRFTKAGQEKIIQLEHGRGSSTSQSIPVEASVTPE